MERSRILLIAIAWIFSGSLSTIAANLKAPEAPEVPALSPARPPSKMLKPAKLKRRNTASIPVAPPPPPGYSQKKKEAGNR